MDFEFFLLFAGEIYLPALNDVSALLLGFLVVAIVLAAAVKIILYFVGS